MLALLYLLACEDTQQQSHFEIPTEAYDWSCYDYPDHSEIIITAGVCNELDSMTATVLLIGNNSSEISLNHDGGCWWSSSTTQNENCIEIQEIVITAQEGGSNGR